MWLTYNMLNQIKKQSNQNQNQQFDIVTQDKQQNTVMMLRILPFFRTVAPIFISRRPVFYFSDSQQDFDAYYYNYEVEFQMRPQYNTFQEVMSFILSNEGKLKDEQIKETIKLMLVLKYTAKPWENLSGFTKSLQTFDANLCNVDTLGWLCGLVPLLTRNFAYDYNYYNKILQRVKYVLKDPEEQISNYSILNFLQAAYELEKKDLIQTLHIIISERMSRIKYFQYPRWLQVLSKRKITMGKQVQNFDFLINKIDQEMKQLDAKSLIGCYKHLKTMNPKIWRIEDIVKKLEYQIQSRIDDFDERQILSLLTLKKELNIFQRQIYNKLMESLEEGKSSIGAQNFFKLFRRMEISENTKVVGNNEVKMMSFLYDNLADDKNILNIIQKDILTRQSLAKLAARISESQHRQKYEKNYSYVYQMVIKGIPTKNNYRQYIEILSSEVKKANLGTKFISNALIVERIHSINPQDMQIRALYEQFKKLIKEDGKQGKMFNSSYYSNQSKLLEHFHRKYGNLFVDNVVKETSEPGKKLSPSVLSYMLVGNASRDLMKILKANPNAISISHTTSILKKVCSNNIAFLGRHSLISQLLAALLTPQSSYYDKMVILRYLCNWQIHVNLTAEEAAPFLKLAQVYVKSMSKNIFLLKNFFVYFSESPSSAIRMSQQYIVFLKTVEDKILSMQGKQGVQKSTLILAQLSKHSMMSMKMAQRVLEGLTDKTNRHIMRYAEVVCGKKPTIDEEINADNLMVIVRSKQLRDEDIEVYLDQINQAISKLRHEQVSNILANFSMRKTPLTTNILESLLKKYMQVLLTRPKIKLLAILVNMQRMSIASPAYNQFLRIACSKYANNASLLSLYAHSLLLRQCVGRGVECRDYAIRLMEYVQDKYANWQIRVTDNMEIIQNFVAVDFELAFNLFVYAHRFCDAHERRALYEWLLLGNLAEEKIKADIVNFIRDIGGIELTEGMFAYLSVWIPEMKQLGSLITIVPVQEGHNWFIDGLENYLQSKQVDFTTASKFGEKAINIDGKYIVTTNLLYSENAKNKVRQHFGTLLGIGAAERNNIIVLFVGHNSNMKTIAAALSLELGVLKQHRDMLATSLAQSQAKYHQRRKRTKSVMTSSNSPNTKSPNKHKNEGKANKKQESSLNKKQVLKNPWSGLQKQLAKEPKKTMKPL